MSVVFLFGGFKVCAYKHCGKNFEPKGHRTLYCSLSCCNMAAMGKWRSRQPKRVFEERKCKMCSDPFTPTREWQRFCDPKCALFYSNNFTRKKRKKVGVTVGNEQLHEPGIAEPLSQAV